MAIAWQSLSLKQFLGLPEAKPALEYVDGVVRQKVAPKLPHSHLQSKLAEGINQFTEPRKLALAFTELRVTFGGRSYVPDVTVYLWDRISVDVNGNLLEDCSEPPDIAIEILSPGQSAAELALQCQWYVDHDARLALLIDPRRKRVRDFRPGRPVRSLGNADAIDFTEVLPDCTWPVQDLFALLRLSR
ncbi:MAG TPA: Uma2 family endonuclease [Chloroflexota bacterium]